MKTLFSLLVCFPFLLISCSKESKSKNVPIQFLLTNEPIDYDSVNVHINGLKINMQEDSTSWIDINAKDTIVNLLDLQNGVSMILAQTEVPDGFLKEVRLILGAENYVVVDGVRYELETPSAQQSGLKIKINKNLNENLNTFILDFDAEQSIKEVNGSYKLHPVIHLKN